MQDNQGSFIDPLILQLLKEAGYRLEGKIWANQERKSAFMNSRFVSICNPESSSLPAQGSAGVAYWKERCKLAERVNEENPGDPDITQTQIEANAAYRKFLQENPIPKNESVSPTFYCPFCECDVDAEDCTNLHHDRCETRVEPIKRVSRLANLILDLELSYNAIQANDDFHAGLRNELDSIIRRLKGEG